MGVWVCGFFNFHNLFGRVLVFGMAGGLDCSV